MIAILITEIEAYRFLLGQFNNEDDFRCRRLRLRCRDYKDVVPTLCRRVIEEQGKAWDPAKETVQELSLRYESAFGVSIDGMPVSAGAQ